MVVASWGASLWSVDSVFVMKRKVGGERVRVKKKTGKVGKRKER